MIFYWNILTNPHSFLKYLKFKKKMYTLLPCNCKIDVKSSCWKGENCWKLVWFLLNLFCNNFHQFNMTVWQFLQLDGTKPWGLRSNSPSHTVLVTNWQFSTGTFSQTFIVPWKYLIQILKSKKYNFIYIFKNLTLFGYSNNLRTSSQTLKGIWKF